MQLLKYVATLLLFTLAANAVAGPVRTLTFSTSSTDAGFGQGGFGGTADSGSISGATLPGFDGNLGRLLSTQYDYRMELTAGWGVFYAAQNTGFCVEAPCEAIALFEYELLDVSNDSGVLASWEFERGCTTVPNVDCLLRGAELFTFSDSIEITGPLSPSTWDFAAFANIINGPPGGEPIDGPGGVEISGFIALDESVTYTYEVPGPAPLGLLCAALWLIAVRKHVSWSISPASKKQHSKSSEFILAEETGGVPGRAGYPEFAPQTPTS